MAGESHTSRRSAGILACWKDDFLASIVVFLVALPLCMGIAIASGMPPAAGIITGIVGGILVGLLGGSPLQVSGPAAGLSVIVWDLLQTHGYEKLAVILLLAGLIQLLAGLLRLGQWFRAVSPAVVSGMLAGIGVLIVVSQIHVMIDDQPRNSGLANLLAVPGAFAKAIWPPEGTAHQLAALVGVVTLIVMIGWKSLAPRALKLVPGALVGIVVATTLAVSLGMASRGVQTIQLPDSLLGAVRLAPVMDLPSLLGGSLLLAALTVAVVASAETLLCAVAVDQMQNDVRTRYDRELSVQGLGNMVCGLCGALPMTGVIVRSAANVQAGARSRASAILHGLWLIVFVSLAGSLLRHIPVASLAAILIYTGWKLVNPQTIRHLARFGWSEVAIFLATAGSIVATDLLKGIVVGIILALIKLLYTFAHLMIRLESIPEEKKAILYLQGAATFIRLPSLARALEEVPEGVQLHVRFEGLSYIDHACLELLLSWEKQHAAKGGSLVIDWDQLTARFRRPATSPAGEEVERGVVPMRSRSQPDKEPQHALSS